MAATPFNSPLMAKNSITYPIERECLLKKDVSREGPLKFTSRTDT